MCEQDLVVDAAHPVELLVLLLPRWSLSAGLFPSYYDCWDDNSPERTGPTHKPQMSEIRPCAKWDVSVQKPDEIDPLGNVSKGTDNQYRFATPSIPYPFVLRCKHSKQDRNLDN